MKRPFCTICTLFIALEVSYCGVIYDNGPPDDLNGSAHGSEMTHWLQTDNFILNQPARLENVTFWDFEVSAYFTGTITWQIYSDNGSGVPGNLLFSGSSRNVVHNATGYAAGAFLEYITTFDIGPISLSGGSYWLALHNGDLSNNNSQNVYWEATETTTDPASHAREAPYNGPWFSHAFPGLPSDFAFQIGGIAAPAQVALSVEGATAEFSFTSMVGYNYRVEYKDSLENSGWVPLPGADQIPGTGNVIRISDTKIQGRSRRFYRVLPLYQGGGAPVISAFGLIGRTPSISFTTSAGYFYRVEYKDDLSDLSWKAVSGAETIVGTGNVVQLNDPDPNIGTHPRRFYRATLQ